MESSVQLKKEKMSFEEFLAFCDEDTWAEWVNGEIVMFSPASDQHQDLSDFLLTVLRLYVQTRRLGWVRSAPFAMRLPEISHGREPDLLFVKAERINIVQKTYLDGPADVVIEIVSPDSVSRDRGDKFVEYEAAGIQEYWLIDPIRNQAEFYQLSAEGRYTLTLGGAEGIHRSTVIKDFWLDLKWLWQEPLPSPLRVVAEIASIPSQLFEAFERALAGSTEGN